MKEVICPQCHTAFTIDENNFASIVKQVRDSEFQAEFEQSLRPFMPYAYFGKDNTIADGTEGDFVFRDYANGEEYISIMFEMKNEADDSKNKAKNETHLDKLDKDRRKKGCEYAILASMLESDNELYNQGIVNMSHRYDKMYVVRPQFFVPIITLLT